MEYPAAVTYSEALLPQRKNNVIDVSRRGHVFLHELSHMWFGNLVTMKWWNGLWLNEAFAEFICHQCFDEIYKELGFLTTIPWVSFLNSKFRGYREDQLPSTHPIAGEVENTQVACSIFDGITYNKGSAVLKQLMSIVKPATFSVALSNYFKKHAYQNTTLEDLLIEFDRELKKDASNAIDVMDWKEDWINQAGLNSIVFSRDQLSDKAYIEQTASLASHPTLRQHFIRIGFFSEEGDLIGTKDMTTSKTGKDEINLEDVESYYAVLPNFDDLSFVKVILDAGSLDFFTKSYGKIHEPLSRQLILRAVYDMVLVHACSSDYLINLVTTIFATEAESTIYNNAYELITDYMSNHAEKEVENKIKTVLFDHFINKAQTTKLNTTTIECLLRFVHSKENSEKILSIFEIDCETFTLAHCYTLAEMILGYNYGQVYDETTYEKIIQHTKTMDKGDTFLSKMRQFEVMKLDQAKRLEELDRFMINKDKKLSTGQLDEFIAGFNSRFMPVEVKRGYLDRYFAQLADSLRSNSNMYSQVVLS